MLSQQKKETKGQKRSEHSFLTVLGVFVLLLLGCSASSLLQRATPVPQPTRMLEPTFTATQETADLLIIVTPPLAGTPGVIIVPPGVDPNSVIPLPPTNTPLPTPTETPIPTETTIPTDTPIPTETPISEEASEVPDRVDAPAPPTDGDGTDAEIVLVPTETPTPLSESPILVPTETPTALSDSPLPPPDDASSDEVPPDEAPSNEGAQEGDSQGDTQPEQPNTPVVLPVQPTPTATTIPPAAGVTVIPEETAMAIAILTISAQQTAEADSLATAMALTGTPTPTDTPTGTPTATPTDTPTSTPTPTVSPTPYIVVQSGFVNLRTGPGVTYPLVAQLGAGIPVAIVGQNTEGTWYQICCVNGGSVWVAAEHPNIQNDPSKAALLVADDPPTPTPTFTPTNTGTPTNTPTATPYPFERSVGPQFYTTDNPYLTIWIKLSIGFGETEAPADGYFINVTFQAQGSEETFGRPSTDGEQPSVATFSFIDSSGGPRANDKFNYKYEYRPWDPTIEDPRSQAGRDRLIQLIGSGTWTLYVTDGAGNQLSTEETFTTTPNNRNREIYIGWVRQY